MADMSSIAMVRRRRSRDGLLPLTLFSSLGTSELNSSGEKDTEKENKKVRKEKSMSVKEREINCVCQTEGNEQLLYY